MASPVLRLRSIPGFDELREVAPFQGLFISSVWPARSPMLLGAAGITHIVSANGPPTFRMPGITYHVVDIDDDEDEDVASHFPACIAFMDAARRNGGRVLVHCTAGVSRSAAVVLAYIMHHARCSLERATMVLQAARPWIRPNAGFVRQLREFEAGLEQARRKQEHQQQQQQRACELCNLQCITRWHVHTEDFVVLQCDSCDQPMVVLRQHTMAPDANVVQRMQTALATVADAAGQWELDTQQRTVRDHLHWHARSARSDSLGAALRAARMLCRARL